MNSDHPGSAAATTSKLEVDGVPTVVHEGGEGVLEAQLTFAVGMADEPLALRGVTHVIEHLAMFAARRTPAEINAHVDLETTNFYASGTPERVARFLHELTAALCDLPVDRLEVEKGVLQAEGEGGCHPIVAALLSRRYGAQHAGSALFAGAGVGALTAEQVLAFARTWYVADNAVLHLNGTVPQDLQLTLPPGKRPRRERPLGWLDEGPFMISHEGLPVSGAGVLLRLPQDDASHHQGHVTHILRGRIEDECRHRAGHAYTVDVESVTASDGVDVVVHTDAREGKETAVAQAVVKAVHDLAVDGPSPDEVIRSLEALEEARSVAGADTWSRTRHEMSRLLGRPQPPPSNPTATTTLEAQSIQAWVANALPTAVFYVDPAAVADLQGMVRHAPMCATVEALPPGRTYKPRLAARMVSKSARAARLVKTPTGFAKSDEDGVHVVEQDEIAGVMLIQDSCAVVIGHNGCGIAVGDSIFRGSQKLLDELLSSIDQRLVFEDPSLQAKQ